MLAETIGLCPSCLDWMSGRYEARDCPDHGATSRRGWASVEHQQ